LAHDFSWGIFPFVAGLFVVVRGVEQAGLTAPIGHVLHAAGGNPLLSALLGTGVSAAGTNLINNVPMALVLVSAIGPIHGATGRALAYSVLLGCDLGPNLTTCRRVVTCQAYLSPPQLHSLLPALKGSTALEPSRGGVGDG
jgi:arsenical pump membrane protein